MKVLIIFGIKHCGKSTFAKLLEKNKNYKAYDLDALIHTNEYSSYSTIREAYRAVGKERFMDDEEKEMKQLLDKLDYSKTKNKIVIATGGGICDNQKVLTLLKVAKYSNLKIKTVFLREREEVLVKRIKESGIPPFLDKNNLEDSFHDLFNTREKRYLSFCQYMVYLEDYKNQEQIINALDKINS